MVWELMKLAERKKIGVASAASLKTQLSRWENGHVTPDYYQALLCELLALRQVSLALVFKICHPGPRGKAVKGPR